MIVVFSIIYLVSVIAYYKMIQKQHSRGGAFEVLNPDLSDIFFMFFPGVNTIVILNELLENSNLKTTKFFRIKK